MAEFLENCPPNQDVAIRDISEHRFGGIGISWYLNTPDIQLHCPEQTCNGVRFFRYVGESDLTSSEKGALEFLSYECSNYQSFRKIFSLYLKRDNDSQSGQAIKIGEVPPFGPPTPSRLVTLIGPDRDMFFKGRRCEIQGLGIGAFVYYRRVVENQKNRIFDEIVKVARMVGADKDAIAELEAAKKENQFSKAVEGIKHGIPQTLLIKGRNPLLLLHDALSHGVHERGDQECLELATSVRVILVELSERLSQALKDDAELNAAVSKLGTARASKS